VKPRTTGILLTLAILLGAFIYLYEVRGARDRSTSEATDSLLFSDVEPSAIDRIQLTTSDDQLAEVVRSGPGWRLLSPIEFAGDDVALATDPPPRPEDFGLGEQGRGLQFSAGGEDRVLRIGSPTPVGSNTYVEIVTAAGLDPGIIFVETWRTNALRKSLDELRDRRVLHFDHSTIDRLSLEWGKTGGVVLEKRDEAWWLTHPLEERADAATVETLLSDLAFLRAEGFVDAPPSDGALGLARPRLQIAMGGRTDEAGDFELSLQFGRSMAGEWVARAAAGLVYRIGGQRVDDVPRDLVAYRFKEVSRFEVADARSFELAYSPASKGPDGLPLRIEGELVEGDWQTQPLAMDRGKVRALMSELGRLKGIDIVADELGDSERAAVGLAPPRLAIRVWGEADALLADLSLGVVQIGRGILAQRADSTVIYRVDETLQQRIPLSGRSLEADFLALEEEAEQVLEEGAADRVADEDEAGATPTL